MFDPEEIDQDDGVDAQWARWRAVCRVVRSVFRRRRRYRRVFGVADFDAFGNPREEARPAGVPPSPVVDSLNGAFMAGSRWHWPH